MAANHSQHAEISSSNGGAISSQTQTDKEMTGSITATWKQSHEAFMGSMEKIHRTLHLRAHRGHVYPPTRGHLARICLFIQGIVGYLDRNAQKVKSQKQENHMHSETNYLNKQLSDADLEGVVKTHG